MLKGTKLRDRLLVVRPTGWETEHWHVELEEHGNGSAHWFTVTGILIGVVKPRRYCTDAGAWLPEEWQDIYAGQCRIEGKTANLERNYPTLHAGRVRTIEMVSVLSGALYPTCVLIEGDRSIVETGAKMRVQVQRYAPPELLRLTVRSLAKPGREEMVESVLDW